MTNDLPGRIAPVRIAEVRSRVTGIIEQRVFEQGSLVKAGDVLYRIDPRLFQVRVASARAIAAEGAGDGGQCRPAAGTPARAEGPQGGKRRRL